MGLGRVISRAWLHLFPRSDAVFVGGAGIATQSFIVMNIGRADEVKSAGHDGSDEVEIAGYSYGRRRGIDASVQGRRSGELQIGAIRQSVNKALRRQLRCIH